MAATSSLLPVACLFVVVASGQQYGVPVLPPQQQPFPGLGVTSYSLPVFGGDDAVESVFTVQGKIEKLSPFGAFIPSIGYSENSVQPLSDYGLSLSNTWTYDNIPPGTSIIGPLPPVHKYGPRKVYPPYSFKGPVHTYFRQPLYADADDLHSSYDTFTPTYRTVYQAPWIEREYTLPEVTYPVPTYEIPKSIYGLPQFGVPKTTYDPPAYGVPKSTYGPPQPPQPPPPASPASPAPSAPSAPPSPSAPSAPSAPLAGDAGTSGDSSAGESEAPPPSSSSTGGSGSSGDETPSTSTGGGIIDVKEVEVHTPATKYSAPKIGSSVSFTNTVIEEEDKEEVSESDRTNTTLSLGGSIKSSSSVTLLPAYGPPQESTASSLASAEESANGRVHPNTDLFGAGDIRFNTRGSGLSLPVF